MNSHLLVVTLGPIQEFIAVARRTRDLWFGSALLSDISKAAAQEMAALSGSHEHLIFPAPRDKTELNQLNVANIILVQLPAGIEPRVVAEKTKTAAKKRWKHYANHAAQYSAELINKTIWEEQVDDVIEFYSAWVPLESFGSYRDARLQLMRLLAGRKACHDFLPAKGRAGVPKSSLDGARESIFIAGENSRHTYKNRRQILEKNPSLKQRLRLSRGEELDVIGITKRAATSEAFPSVMRIAADPWIRGIEANNGEGKKILSEINNLCCNSIIEKGDKASYPAGSGKKAYYDSTYRYDGSTLFLNRIDSMLRAAEKNNDDSYAYESLLNQKEKIDLRNIKKHLNKLKADYGEPDPYFAVLAADGDQMGKTIYRINDINLHREFSRRLAEFSQKTTEIVSQHNGCLVYAGGDDVLAFVPIDKCLACARELHDRFEEILGKAIPEKPPTLSVGIAIGHCLESLEDLLVFVRAAEKSAKTPNRDGLAVHLYSRGGAPVKIRSQWSYNMDQSLMRWVNMYLNNTLPDKAAFDLRNIAKEYAGWPLSEATNIIIEKDIGRLFSRKGRNGNKLDVELCLEALNRCLLERQQYDDDNNEHKQYHPAAMRLAQEWLIARRLTRAIKQANGKNTQPTKGDEI